MIEEAAKRLRHDVNALADRMQDVYPHVVGDSLHGSIMNILASAGKLLESVEDEYYTGEEDRPPPPGPWVGATHYTVYPSQECAKLRDEGRGAMRIDQCRGCNEPFQSTPAPCPDGREGCLVWHTDKNSYICPKCEYDNAEWVNRLICEGPHHVSVGMGIYNPRGIKKLELWKEDT